MATTYETVSSDGLAQSGGYTIAAPSGVADGDVLIHVGVADGSGAWTDEQGFTFIYNEANTIGGNSCAILAHTVASSEPTSYTFVRSSGTEGYGVGIIRFSGANTTDPIGAISTVSSGVVSGNITCPSPGNAESSDSIILRVWVIGDGSTGGFNDITVPSTEIIKVAYGNLEQLFVSYEASPGAGSSIGTATLTNAGGADGDNFGAFTVEILPSAGGAATILPLINAYYG